METSPTKISDILNIFYVDKIRKIREQFQGNKDDPLQVLRKSIDKWDNKPTRKLKLREVTWDELN